MAGEAVNLIIPGGAQEENANGDLLYLTADGVQTTDAYEDGTNGQQVALQPPCPILFLGCCVGADPLGKPSRVISS